MIKKEQENLRVNLFFLCARIRSVNGKVSVLDKILHYDFQRRYKKQCE